MNRQDVLARDLSSESDRAEHQGDRPSGVAASSPPPSPESSTSATDADLLRRLRERDSAAALELYERFASDVNRIIWRLLGADRDHNDLVHDVLLTAWTETRNGKRPDDLRSWIVGIAAHRVRREIRRRGIYRRYRALVAPLKRQTPPDDGEATDLLRKIYALLEGLAANERVAFCLRYLDRRSLVETAEACGCSLATAKRRLKRARERLVDLAEPQPDIKALLVASWGEDE